MKNASDFSGLYDDLVPGWDLGCLMLDTERPYNFDLKVPAKDQYVSDKPYEKYVRGLSKDWHVTVKYGLLNPVRRRHVDRVIEGLEFPSSLTVVDYSVFPGGGGEYEYVLAHVDALSLRMLNKQLHVLPNIDTFVDYMPHVTVGYFRPGWWEENRHRFVTSLGTQINVLGFNYGDRLLAP